MNNNYWNNAIPMYNIGGIFGAGFFQGYTQYASFWGNMIAKGLPSTFALHLVPSESDWSWIPNAPNLTALGYTSALQVGRYNGSTYANPSNPTSLTIGSYSVDAWVFNLTSFAFGYQNTTVEPNE